MDKHGKQLEELLKFADADGDKTVSFTEFFFFITLLNIGHDIIYKDFNEYEGKMTE